MKGLFQCPPRATPWGCMNPARRPGGFAIRRKKRFDPLKLGDL